MTDTGTPRGFRTRGDRIRLSVAIGFLSGICVFAAVLVFYSLSHKPEGHEDFWLLPAMLLEPLTEALAAAVVGYRVLSAPAPGLGGLLVSSLVAFAGGGPLLALLYAGGGPWTVPEAPLSLLVGALAGALPPAAVAIFRRASGLRAARDYR